MGKLRLLHDGPFGVHGAAMGRLKRDHMLGGCVAGLVEMRALNLDCRFAVAVLGFWDFGILGFWDFGILGFWNLHKRMSKCPSDLAIGNLVTPSASNANLTGNRV